MALRLDGSGTRALLDNAASVTLSVLEGDVTCDGSAGAIAFPNGVEAAKELVARDLGAAGCPAEVRFCGDVTVSRSAAVRVLSAVAKDAEGNALAAGCASARLDADRVPVAIAMVRVVPPAQCGDDVIALTEQCEPGGGPICDAACQTQEILLSVGSAQNGTTTGRAGDKTDPFLLWPEAAAPAGRFLAFYSARVGGGGNNVDVALRAMGDDLLPLASPPALAIGEIYLPNGAAFPPPPAAFRQSAPQAAFANGKYYVVFQDDDAPTVDIHLRSMDSSFVAEQGTPVVVNGASTPPAGEPNVQETPAIAAGPSDTMLVAWTDASAGKIMARTFTPPATFGAQREISSGSGNARPSVAGGPDGFRVVWQSPSGVRLRNLGSDGAPSAPEEALSNSATASDRAGVATLSDGRFAVSWSVGGDVFVQRYDARGAKISGGDVPVNDVVEAGVQAQVAIGATTAARGGYVVAWVDEGSGHVRGRMLDATSGFLVNHVNGLTSEFQVSRANGRVRALPAVAGGGAGYVAIGWEDRSNASGAGVVVRRFPKPVAP